MPRVAAEGGVSGGGSSFDESAKSAAVALMLISVLRVRVNRFSVGMGMSFADDRLQLIGHRYGDRI